MIGPHLQAFADAAGSRIVDSIVAGLLLVFLVWGSLRVTRCRNSGTRFAVWFCALIATGALALIGCAVTGGSASATEPVLQDAPHLIFSDTWALCALLIWCVGAGFGLLRIAVSLCRLRSLRRNADALPDEKLGPSLRRAIQESRRARNVRVYVSDQVQVPSAIGYIRPAVIIPRWAVRELSTNELHAVFLHELGHLRRWDDWTNLAQRLLRAILFFHPAVWWIDSHLSVEREMACDDLVLSHTSDARSYAHCLVSVAEKSLLRSSLALGLAAVSRVRHTTARIARILDPNRIGDTRLSKPSLAAVTALSLLALVAVPYAPTVVEFRNPTHTVVASQVADNPRLRAHVVPAVATLERPQVVSASLSNYPVQSKATAAHARAAHMPRQRLVRAAAVGKPSVQPMVVFVVQTSFGPDRAWVQIWRLTLTTAGGMSKQVQQFNGVTAKSI